MNGAAGVVTKQVDLGYTPRRWQARVHRLMRRFSVLVVHRRGGKTVLAIITLIDAAMRDGLPMRRYGYIAPLLKQARLNAWDYLKAYGLKIYGAQANESMLELALPNGNKIRLFGADNPDSIRGTFFDGVVLDEVAQMKPQVWGEIIRPALADRKGWALFIGTPQGVNLFSELYYRALEDPSWFAGLYTYLDTEALDDEEIELARQTMTESQFRQEMLCDFGAGANNTLFSLEELQAAAHRHLGPDTYRFAPRVLGVDCARYGDDSSVITPRQGLAMFKQKSYRQVNTMELAALVAQAIDRFQPVACFVDIGGLGAGVVDRLTQLKYPQVIGVDFGSRPIDARYENKRAEMYAALANWVRQGGALPNTQRLIQDMAALTFSYANARGRFELESKDELKERGLPSPDHGDSAALTFAFPVAQPEDDMPRGRRNENVFTLDQPWDRHPPSRGDRVITEDDCWKEAA